MTTEQLIELAEEFQRIAALDHLQRTAMKTACFDEVDGDALRMMVRWLRAVEELSGNDEELGDTVATYVAIATESLRRRRSDAN